MLPGLLGLGLFRISALGINNTLSGPKSPTALHSADFGTVGKRAEI
jgi:hypothetical protein